VLEASYVAFRLPPFVPNPNRRLVQTPKLFFYDRHRASRREEGLGILFRRPHFLDLLEDHPRHLELGFQVAASRSRKEAVIRSLEIHDARPADAPALAALLGELGFPAPANAVASRLDSMIRAAEVVLVAARDGVLLGLVTVHITPVLHRPTPVGRLTVLVVTERARRQGIGRALVEAAERLLTARGCGLVEVTSNQGRTDAHAFYERLGYEATSLRFRKTLSPSVG